MPAVVARHVYDESKLRINGHFNEELHNVALTHTQIHRHTHTLTYSYRLALQAVCIMTTHTGGL